MLTPMQQKIINSAIALYKEKGYGAVTISDICKEAGVSDQSFYRLFTNKDNMFIALYQHADVISDELMQRLMLCETNWGKLWTVHRAYYNFYLELGPDLSAHFLRAVLANKMPLTDFAHKEALYSTNEPLIRRGQETGEIRNTSDAAVIADTIASQMIGLVFQWCSTSGGFDLE
ncbi:MAG: TetR/AcrR family transcriptional regulator, partial [Clostridiales bacterium]|nr:TetR/AcrR family transcriptional regulator [Clostridiales bacterium]